MAEPLTPEEIERIRESWRLQRESFPYDAGRWLATLDAARADSDTPGLDVERLARALTNIEPHICLGARRADFEANRIAAEYARLSGGDSDG